MAAPAPAPSSYNVAAPAPAPSSYNVAAPAPAPSSYNVAAPAPAPSSYNVAAPAPSSYDATSPPPSSYSPVSTTPETGYSPEPTEEASPATGSTSSAPIYVPDPTGDHSQTDFEARPVRVYDPETESFITVNVFGGDNGIAAEEQKLGSQEPNPQYTRAIAPANPNLDKLPRRPGGLGGSFLERPAQDDLETIRSHFEHPGSLEVPIRVEETFDDSKEELVTDGPEQLATAVTSEEEPEVFYIFYENEDREKDIYQAAAQVCVVSLPTAPALHSTILFHTACTRIDVVIVINHGENIKHLLTVHRMRLPTWSRSLKIVSSALPLRRTSGPSTCPLRMPSTCLSTTSSVWALHLGTTGARRTRTRAGGLRATRCACMKCFI